jgi:two-component system CheB/CheR fusion protein
VLQRELQETRESLQSALEERDAHNEELIAALEELQSGNEELQSTNEELQTAKEELQSTNEELTTLNEELENRNREMSLALGNLTNVVDSVRLPIVIVDSNLRIRLYNPSAVSVLNIVPTDIGRSISHVKTRLNIAELEPVIQEVMRSLQAHDQEVEDREGRWYAMRIRPYKSLENKIDGAVLTWTDISALKSNLSANTAAQEQLTSIAGSLREPVLVLDADLRVQSANPAYYSQFQATPAEVEGRRLYELGTGQWDLPDVHRLLDEGLRDSTQFQSVEVERDFPGLGRRTMLLNARRVQLGSAQREHVLLTIEDITTVKQLTEMEQLRQLSARMQAAREDERTTLARDIHDELGGSLSGLKMYLYKLRDGLRSDQDDLLLQVQEMSDLIDSEINYVRRIAASLRPSILDDLGLVAAIEWQLAEFRQRTGLHTNFHSNVETLMLPPEVTTAAFRIFQEALTNVGRHAQASEVRVELKVEGDELKLEVNDNGRGMAPEQLDSKQSLGLTGLRERVHEFAGQVEINSAPGQGTRVQVRLPVPRPNSM